MNDYKELVAELRKWQTLGDAPVGNGFGVIVDKLTLNQAADAIEQLVKERDAAVADLTVFDKCKICKHYDEKSANYGYTEFCENCGAYPWADDEEPNKWEWCGVQEACE